MRSLKDGISAALTGFEGKGITVEQRQGRIHVSMENKLLFPSGSTVVDAQGKQALKDLAKAIEGESRPADRGRGPHRYGQGPARLALQGQLGPERDAGHQRGAHPQDNGRIDPVRITAAGRGEFLPWTLGKARNRRIGSSCPRPHPALQTGDGLKAKPPGPGRISCAPSHGADRPTLPASP